MMLTIVPRRPAYQLQNSCFVDVGLSGEVTINARGARGARLGDYHVGLIKGQ